LHEDSARPNSSANTAITFNGLADHLDQIPPSAIDPKGHDYSARHIQQAPDFPGFVATVPFHTPSATLRWHEGSQAPVRLHCSLNSQRIRGTRRYAALPANNGAHVRHYRSVVHALDQLNTRRDQDEIRTSLFAIMRNLYMRRRRQGRMRRQRVSSSCLGTNFGQDDYQQSDHTIIHKTVCLFSVAQQCRSVAPKSRDARLERCHYRRRDWLIVRGDRPYCTLRAPTNAAHIVWR
jgi:hypothetical protein